MATYVDTKTRHASSIGERLLRILGRVGVHIPLILWGITNIFLVGWLLMSALKTNQQIANQQIVSDEAQDPSANFRRRMTIGANRKGRNPNQCGFPHARRQWRPCGSPVVEFTCLLALYLH